MSLKLGEWANVAEIVSAVAVVISLVYVGYQINQNTQEIRASNRQALVDRAVDATRDLATDQKVSKVLAKVRAGEDLDNHESTQYGYVLRSVLYDVQEAYLLHKEGRLEDGYWATRGALIKLYLSPDLARQVYLAEKQQGLLHPEFARWIDQEILKDQQ